MVMLSGVEVATCVRQGSVRAVWPEIVNGTMRWIEEHGYEQVGLGRDHALERYHRPGTNKNIFELQVPIRRPGDPVPLVAPQRIVDGQSLLSK